MTVPVRMTSFIPINYWPKFISICREVTCLVVVAQWPLSLGQMTWYTWSIAAPPRRSSKNGIHSSRTSANDHWPRSASRRLSIPYDERIARWVNLCLLCLRRKVWAVDLYRYRATCWIQCDFVEFCFMTEFAQKATINSIMHKTNVWWFIRQREHEMDVLLPLIGHKWCSTNWMKISKKEVKC